MKTLARSLNLIKIIMLKLSIFAECNRSPHPTKPNYYIESPGEGHDPITRQCAPGTLYNINTCLCDLHDDTPGSSNLGGG